MKRKHLSQFNSLIKKKKFFLIEPFLKTTTAETCKGEFVLVHLPQANVTICICEKRGNKNKPAAAMNGNGEHRRIQIFNKRRILTLAHFLSMAQNLFFNAKIDYSAYSRWVSNRIVFKSGLRTELRRKPRTPRATISYWLSFSTKPEKKKKGPFPTHSVACFVFLHPATEDSGARRNASAALRSKICTNGSTG